jgi:hypothetical protein
MKDSKVLLLKGLQFTSTKATKEPLKATAEVQTPIPNLMQLSPANINALSVLDLVSCLDNNAALKSSSTPLENPFLTLLIDQRQFSDFKEEHLASSINISLTPIIRRYDFIP